MNKPKQRRTCDELGLCQADLGRRPPCSSCDMQAPHPYAPGVIEQHRRPTTFWLATAAIALRLVPACAVIGLSLGWATGKGWL